MKNIALTTDFSEQARAAYAAASSMARTYGATVHLLHEASRLSHPWTELEPAGFEPRLEQALADEAGSPALEGVPVRTHLLCAGRPHRTVLEFVAGGEADMLVVATHGHTGVGHALLGSFAEKLARSAIVPVLTFRQGADAGGPFAPRSVVMPFDFSDNAAAAFPLARKLHEQYDCKFTVVEVVSLDTRLADHFGQQSRLYDDLRVAMLEAPRRMGHQLRTRCDTELPGAQVEVDVLKGQPAAEIVKHAERRAADLILMATHGRSGVQHLLMGSVAEKVLRTASCPVLTIRPR